MKGTLLFLALAYSILTQSQMDGLPEFMRMKLEDRTYSSADEISIDLSYHVDLNGLEDILPKKETCPVVEYTRPLTLDMNSLIKEDLPIEGCDKIIPDLVNQQGNILFCQKRKLIYVSINNKGKLSFSEPTDLAKVLSSIKGKDSDTAISECYNIVPLRGWNIYAATCSVIKIKGEKARRFVLGFVRLSKDIETKENRIFTFVGGIQITPKENQGFNGEIQVAVAETVGNDDESMRMPIDFLVTQKGQEGSLRGFHVRLHNSYSASAGFYSVQDSDSSIKPINWPIGVKKIASGTAGHFNIITQNKLVHGITRCKFVDTDKKVQLEQVSTLSLDLKCSEVKEFYKAKQTDDGFDLFIKSKSHHNQEHHLVGFSNKLFKYANYNMNGELTDINTIEFSNKTNFITPTNFYVFYDKTILVGAAPTGEESFVFIYSTTKNSMNDRIDFGESIIGEYLIREDAFLPGNEDIYFLSTDTLRVVNALYPRLRITSNKKVKETIKEEYLDYSCILQFKYFDKSPVDYTMKLRELIVRNPLPKFKTHTKIEVFTKSIFKFQLPVDSYEGNGLSWTVSGLKNINGVTSKILFADPMELTVKDEGSEQKEEVNIDFKSDIKHISNEFYMINKPNTIQILSCTTKSFDPKIICLIIDSIDKKKIAENVVVLHATGTREMIYFVLDTRNSDSDLISKANIYSTLLIYKVATKTINKYNLGALINRATMTVSKGHVLIFAIQDEGSRLFFSRFKALDYAEDYTLQEQPTAIKKRLCPQRIRFFPSKKASLAIYSYCSSSGANKYIFQFDITYDNQNKPILRLNTAHDIDVFLEPEFCLTQGFIHVIDTRTNNFKIVSYDAEDNDSSTYNSEIEMITSIKTAKSIICNHFEGMIHVAGFQESDSITTEVKHSQVLITMYGNVKNNPQRRVHSIMPITQEPVLLASGVNYQSGELIVLIMEKKSGVLSAISILPSGPRIYFDASNVTEEITDQIELTAIDFSGKTFKEKTSIEFKSLKLTPSVSFIKGFEVSEKDQVFDLSEYMAFEGFISELKYVRNDDLLNHVTPRLEKSHSSQFLTTPLKVEVVDQDDDDQIEKIIGLKFSKEYILSWGERKVTFESQRTENILTYEDGGEIKLGDLVGTGSEYYGFAVSESNSLSTLIMFTEKAVKDQEGKENTTIIKAMIEIDEIESSKLQVLMIECKEEEIGVCFVAVFMNNFMQPHLSYYLLNFNGKQLSKAEPYSDNFIRDIIDFDIMAIGTKYVVMFAITQDYKGVFCALSEIIKDEGKIQLIEVKTQVITPEIDGNYPLGQIDTLINCRKMNEDLHFPHLTCILVTSDAYSHLIELKLNGLIHQIIGDNLVKESSIGLAFKNIPNFVPTSVIRYGEYIGVTYVSDIVENTREFSDAKELNILGESCLLAIFKETSINLHAIIKGSELGYTFSNNEFSYIAADMGGDIVSSNNIRIYVRAYEGAFSIFNLGEFRFVVQDWSKIDPDSSNFEYKGLDQQGPISIQLQLSSSDYKKSKVNPATDLKLWLAVGIVAFIALIILGGVLYQIMRTGKQEDGVDYYNETDLVSANDESYEI